MAQVIETQQCHQTRALICYLENMRFLQKGFCIHRYSKTKGRGKCRRSCKGCGDRVTVLPEDSLMIMVEEEVMFKNAAFETHI